MTLASSKDDYLTLTLALPNLNPNPNPNLNPNPYPNVYEVTTHTSQGGIGTHMQRGW